MQKLKNESGAIMVLSIAVTLVFGIMAALAIDLGYGEVVQNRLQMVADATALASTAQLARKSQKGWKLAKRNAFIALRSNKINSHNDLLETPGYFGDTQSLHPKNRIDPLEIAKQSPYRNTHYQVGNLAVVIERGYYGKADNGKTTCTEHLFYSLEGSATNNQFGKGVNGNTFLEAVDSEGIDADSDGIAHCGGRGESEGHRCGVHLLANATRVTLTLSSLNGAFTSFFPGGSDAMESIKVVGVSALNTFADYVPTTCAP